MVQIKFNSNTVKADCAPDVDTVIVELLNQKSVEIKNGHSKVIDGASDRCKITRGGVTEPYPVSKGYEFPDSDNATITGMFTNFLIIIDHSLKVLL
jgi:hypothetical protein